MSKPNPSGKKRSPNPKKTEGNGAGNGKGKASDPLVGRWFYSMEEGRVHWQGQILHALPGQRYLIQLYSWLDGGPTNQQMTTLAQMSTWLFYETDEDMRNDADRLRRAGLLEI